MRTLTLSDYQSSSAKPMEARWLPTSQTWARVYHALIISQNIKVWYCDGGFWGCSKHPTKGSAMARLTKLERMESRYRDLTGLLNIRDRTNI